MRPGLFYDRPPMWPFPPVRQQTSCDCIHLRPSSYAVFHVYKTEVDQVQADFLLSDSTSPAFIRNKPQVVHADFAESDSTSPAYIYNKPIIVQADYSDSNSTSPAFIRNKPDLSKLSPLGSQWDLGDTPLDLSMTGFFWSLGL